MASITPSILAPLAVSIPSLSTTKLPLPILIVPPDIDAPVILEPALILPVKLAPVAVSIPLVPTTKLPPIDILPFVILQLPLLSTVNASYLDPPIPIDPPLIAAPVITPSAETEKVGLVSAFCITVPIILPPSIVVPVTVEPLILVLVIVPLNLPSFAVILPSLSIEKPSLIVVYPSKCILDASNVTSVAFIVTPSPFISTNDPLESI